MHLLMPSTTILFLRGHRRLWMMHLFDGCFMRRQKCSIQALMWRRPAALCKRLCSGLGHMPDMQDTMKPGSQGSWPAFLFMQQGEQDPFLRLCWMAAHAFLAVIEIWAIMCRRPSQWLTAAKAVLQGCISLVGSGQSCCTWGPYEAALSVAEQLASVPGEDLTGWSFSNSLLPRWRVWERCIDAPSCSATSLVTLVRSGTLGPSAEAALERASLELAHKFPWRPAAVVALSAILHRRMLAADAPSRLADRRRLAKVGRRPVVCRLCVRCLLDVEQSLK